jgi:outer membrane protein TolC
VFLLRKMRFAIVLRILLTPSIGVLWLLPASASNEPTQEQTAHARLNQAIANPEFMLRHWVELPTSPQIKTKKIQHLSLREAILLALRYNPNILNAELDRIIQRYQLRLANNEFELQYALAGAAAINKSRFQGVGTSTNRSLIGTPEVNLKTQLGTQLSLNLDNNVSMYNDYSPVVNLSVTQPLLRGAGFAANNAGLLDAKDNEWLNKINLRQAVADQVTQVIAAYRSLILSGNNLQNQRRQWDDAKKSFTINKQKIAAGQLERTANVQQSYQIESLNLMVEQAENDFKTAAQDLLQTIGLDPQLRLAVPNDVEVKKVIVPNLQVSIDKALSHNSQYLAQKITLRADERAYAVAKNQQRWQLDLSANVQSGIVTDVESNKGFQSIYNGRNINESARLTMTIPLHDVNRRSQLINAKVRLEKDRLNLLAVKRALITNVTNIISTIESLAKRFRLAEKQVKLAEESYELEKKKQQAGIATALDVNNTQNQLLQAQAGLIGAKISYLNQLAALQRLLGTTLDEWRITLRFGE